MTFLERYSLLTDLLSHPNIPSYHHGQIFDKPIVKIASLMTTSTQTRQLTGNTLELFEIISGKIR